MRSYPLGCGARPGSATTIWSAVAIPTRRETPLLMIFDNFQLANEVSGLSKVRRCFGLPAHSKWTCAATRLSLIWQFLSLERANPLTFGKAYFMLRKL